MSKTNLNELYRTLHRLNRQMHRSAHHEGRHGKGGLYQGQANLLLLIYQNDGSYQRDLAEQLDVRPSSMTEMLLKLEQKNLIVRKQDDKDQRVMRIYLTEEGRKEAEELADNKDNFAESFFRALTDDEQEELLILTKKLCAYLEAAEDAYGEESHYGHGYGRGCHGGHRHCSGGNHDVRHGFGRHSNHLHRFEN